jgi:hypothetical protein
MALNEITARVKKLQAILTFHQSALSEKAFTVNDIRVVVPLRRNLRLECSISLPSCRSRPKSESNPNTNRRVSAMNAAPYDILKKDVLGNPIWVEAVEDLHKATLRIEELVLYSPGEYIVFNQKTSQIVSALSASAAV